MSNKATEPVAHWAEAVSAALTEHQHRPGALLPILHAVQERLGWVPSDAVPVIANALNLSRAEVHGVVSFYHDFRDTPRGKHMLKICRAESCQAVGADTLVAHAKQQLGIEFHETSNDGKITLEPVYCLGNCALSPAMAVDNDVYGRVTPDRFDAVVAKLKATK